ncbi:MAG: DJ-1/PfpI family protein [Clostridia bacterium]|nr:DJ-1/PfpI family protein [Clostridia bacterium]
MVYMFLATGFEEVEALCPLDLCRRAGIEVTTVGVGGQYVTGSHGITVKADVSEADTVFSADRVPGDLDGVILPGGMPGTENLYASPAVLSALGAAEKSGKMIAAICAAPSVPGRLGMLGGRRAVCYPGFEEKLLGASVPDGERVVCDGNFITGVGMGAALEFGLAIVAYFKGAKSAASLSDGVLAPAGLSECFGDCGK